jgi:hypothetical protein
MQMIGTESLVDCLRTPFLRRSSGFESLVDAYVPLLGGSGQDVVQELDLSEGHADDWDRVFDRLPTYLFKEDQVKT